MSVYECTIQARFPPRDGYREATTDDTVLYDRVSYCKRIAKAMRKGWENGPYVKVRKGLLCWEEPLVWYVAKENENG